MFLEISPNSEENTCARVSFSIKLQVAASGVTATIMIKKSKHAYFSRLIIVTSQVERRIVSTTVVQVITAIAVNS